MKPWGVELGYHYFGWTCFLHILDRRWRQHVSIHRNMWNCSGVLAFMCTQTNGHKVNSSLWSRRRLKPKQIQSILQVNMLLVYSLRYSLFCSHIPRPHSALELCHCNVPTNERTANQKAVTWPLVHLNCAAVDLVEIMSYRHVQNVVQRALATIDICSRYTKFVFAE